MTNNNNRQNKGAGAGDDSSAKNKNIAIAIDSLHRTYKASSDGETKRASKNLKWTKRGIASAWLYTVLTAALLGAGVYSAIKASDAVKQASRAADAAGHAADTARDTEERSLRAYVGVKDLVISADRR